MHAAAVKRPGSFIARLGLNAKRGGYNFVHGNFQNGDSFTAIPPVSGHPWDQA